MEKLVIEGICNKDDSYREQLTPDNKLAIGNFLRSIEQNLKSRILIF